MTAAPPRPRVLLDCDGVLSDFAGGLLPIRWVTLHNRAEPWGGLETCDWEMIRRRAEAAYMHLRGEESAL